MSNPVACPNCGSDNIKTVIETEQVRVGYDPDGPFKEATLTVPNVPHRVCGNCGFAYSDYAGEEVQDRYVTTYWRLQRTPDQALKDAILACVWVDHRCDLVIEEPTEIRKQLLELLGVTPLPEPKDAAL